MGKLIRCITSDGAVMATAVDSTDIINKAVYYQRTSAVVSAALGRLLTAASMMGDMLKGSNDSITLRVAADGEIGSLIAVSDSNGDVRGYVMNPVVEIPLNSMGKLDVSGAVGKNGTLFVFKDLGLKEPYSGQVPLVSGEIAEDITSYYAMSEQIPTVCALGVLVNPDLTIKAAGGYLIQLLPGADDDTINKLEQSIAGMDSVTKLLSAGETIESIVRRALKDFEVEVLDEHDVSYKCNCSMERVEKALLSMGPKELLKLADEQKLTEAKCHFCDRIYRFPSNSLRKLAEKEN
ncbi:MAG: Hsp33 family molecular chaperone HslO [Oscillospiraceae bacterium]|nr:Hsp33 family molecular chaperone HslO [Oscillospiraceae bacterium]